MRPLSDDAAVPAYFTVPLAPPDRQPLPERAAGIWASIALAGETVVPVHVGSGVPDLADGMLVAGIPMEPTPDAVPGGTGPLRLGPLLPGAGVKGALRAVFEAVTYACDPLEAPCGSLHRVCPACALFGMAGLRGALAVSDFTVEGATGVLRIPQRYSHPDAPRQGRRLYGMAPEAGTAEAEEILLVIEPGARLAGAFSVAGAEPWAVGALALVAGLLPAGLPLLRLGGGKNRGLGAARLRLAGGTYARSQRAWLLGGRHDLTVEVLNEWAQAADDAGSLRDDQIERIRKAYSSDG